MRYSRYQSIRFHQLQVFATVARERSFHRAAEALYLTQPAISEHIKALERLLGVRLFHRSRGRTSVELTEAGQVLLETCVTVFDALERGTRALDEIREVKGNQVTFGSGISFSGHLLPRVVESFRLANPHVKVRVVVGSSDQLLEEIKKRQVDMAVLGRPFVEPGIMAERVGYYHVVLVGPVGHRLAAGPAAPFHELARERMLLPDRSIRFRQAIDQLAAESGVELNVAMEMNSAEAKLQAIVDGFGIAPLRLHTVQPALAAGQVAVLHVQGFPLVLDWWLTYREYGLSSAGRLLRDHLLQLLSSADDQ